MERWRDRERDAERESVCVLLLQLSFHLLTGTYSVLFFLLLTNPSVT
jgi:hypothetical protein